MSGNDVLVTTRNRVCLVTINRPDRRNARDHATNLGMMNAIIDADHDPEIAMIAITGAGDKAFCSGADLKADSDQFETAKHVKGPVDHPERSVMEVILDTRKPVMAIINGPAVAGGFELALACDLRVAADTAFFSLPEAKRGRGAHFASVVLPQFVPSAIALEWLFTGRRIPIEEAQRWGLINRIAPFDKLMDAAMELAAEVISSAPLSLQKMKMTARRTAGMPLHAGLRLDVGPNLYETEDQKEGVRAYLEKRKPQWQGR
jgi:enoyl-CoA hydratase/carnithine racemase